MSARTGRWIYLITGGPNWTTPKNIECYCDEGISFSIGEMEVPNTWERLPISIPTTSSLTLAFSYAYGLTKAIIAHGTFNLSSILCAPRDISCTAVQW